MAVWEVGDLQIPSLQPFFIIASADIHGIHVHHQIIKNKLHYKLGACFGIIVLCLIWNAFYKQELFIFIGILILVEQMGFVYEISPGCEEDYGKKRDNNSPRPAFCSPY